MNVLHILSLYGSVNFLTALPAILLSRQITQYLTRYFVHLKVDWRPWTCSRPFYRMVFSKSSERRGICFFIYVCAKWEREIERKIEKMTRVEAWKRSLIFPRFLFNFPSLLCAYTNVPVASDNIYTMLVPCTLENIPPPEGNSCNLLTSTSRHLT